MRHESRSTYRQTFRQEDYTGLTDQIRPRLLQWVSYRSMRHGQRCSVKPARQVVHPGNSQGSLLPEIGNMIMNSHGVPEFHACDTMLHENPLPLLQSLVAQKNRSFFRPFSLDALFWKLIQPRRQQPCKIAAAILRMRRIDEKPIFYQTQLPWIFS